MQLLATVLIILEISRGFAFINAPHSFPISAYTATSPTIQHRKTSIISSARKNSDNDSTTVASQAALIAGTTIGGGFLALPAATAPCGAAPAALGLIVVWFYLLAGALSLSNAIFMLKRQEEGGNVKFGDVSLFSLVRECFGSSFGMIAGLLFLLLIKVTLIAQLSKIGVLLNSAFPILCCQIWISIFSVTMGALCMFGTKRKVEGINDVLTATMLFSFTTLVILAGGSGWSLNGLMRSNYNSLLPASTNSGPWAIPIFIQLLIYNEVVPLVASRLKDEGKVRQAVVYGSLIPLAMCLIWSCVALGIVPYNPSQIASGVIYDPLTKLSDTVLSKKGLVGRAFLASVNILAGSAICTTVIGSIFASTQYFQDTLSNLIDRGQTNLDKSNNMKILTHVLAIAPSATIAAFGSSELYYRATSFAGEFPCTLLYGFIPPLCNLRLRWICNRNDSKDKISADNFIFQVLLAVVSFGILVTSASLRS